MNSLICQVNFIIMELVEYVFISDIYIWYFEIKNDLSL
jgi:hypothetical protein